MLRMEIAEAEAIYIFHYSRGCAMTGGWSCVSEAVWHDGNERATLTTQPLVGSLVSASFVAKKVTFLNSFCYLFLPVKKGIGSAVSEV